MADQPHEEQPELLDNRTIELMILGARALVIVVYVMALVTFAILTLGFFLLLAGASSEASFVEWVYRNTSRAMEPFRGMFPIREIDGQSVFDASLLFAAAVYGFFAIGLHALVNYLTGLARARHIQAVRDDQRSYPSAPSGPSPSAGSVDRRSGPPPEHLLSSPEGNQLDEPRERA